MIFSELYGVYYRTLAQILTAAVDHPLQKGEMRAMIERYRRRFSNVRANAMPRAVIGCRRSCSGMWRRGMRMSP